MDTDIRLHHLEEENRRLHDAVEELSFLNSLARQIGAMGDPDSIVETIVRRSLHAVGAEQGVITLSNRESADPMRTLVREMTTSVPRTRLRLDETLLGWMHIHREPLIVNTPHGDCRFPAVAWDPGIRSLLAAPLLLKSELIGLLTVYNKKSDGGFTQDDQRLLSIIAAQSAQVIENARLAAEERALIALQGEMRIAADIQRSLLPLSPPVLPGYTCAGVSHPAQVVGGDYFDFIPLGDDRWALAVGDVSGKGMPAAIFMALCRALVRSNAALHPDPASCLAAINASLCSDANATMFLTLFSGILDARSGTVVYCTGGHVLPLLRRADGAVETLAQTPGMLVGLMEEATFGNATVRLRPGDLMLVYTDGVSEAVNRDGDLFGERRLADAVAACAIPDARAAVEAVVREVAAFRGDHPQSDDVTVLAVRRDDGGS